MDSEHPTGSTVPPASPSHSRRPSRLVRALRRVLASHWGKILVIWALVTGSLGFVIFNRVRPAYESVSLLRLEPPADRLIQPGAATEWEPFLQTQVEQIRSAPVLSAALTKNAVAATRLVREAQDPESEITSTLGSTRKRCGPPVSGRSAGTGPGSRRWERPPTGGTTGSLSCPMPQ
jgi:hypothetical protein